MSKLFKFIKNGVVQTDLTKSFGYNTTNTCRVTSSFPIATLTSCYSMLPGTILLMQQSGVGNQGKANLILKPNDNKDLLLPIKYIIYRGLDLTLFLSSTDITNITTTVLSTGLELLVKMQTIQSGRTTDPIPVTALFGHDLNAPGTTKLDTFFYKQVTIASQLFAIEGGVELGKYLVGEGGIEIILQNSEYEPTVDMAKAPFHEIDASSGSALEIKWKKDLVRHFVDPAAFYGLHYDVSEGMEYVDSSNVRQPVTAKLDIYTHFIEVFATKDKVYLDIRNENGYSFNYYNNYVGSSGLDATKELKTGDTSTGVTAKEYYTNGWPIHTVSITPSATDEDNTFFLQLRVNDNQKPLLAGNKKMIPLATAPDIDQHIQFINETVLVPGSTTPEFTTSVEIKIPNKLVSGAGASIATIVRLDYIKQIRINDGTDSFPQVTGWDHLFGPIDAEIPWDTADGIQWMGTHHYRFFDGLSQGYAVGSRDLAITTINPALRTITVGSVISEQLNQKIAIKNSTITTNIGDYTILNVQTIGTDTIITVKEALPSTKQTGDTLHFETEVFVYIDKVNNKLIAKDQNLSTITSYQAGAKVKLYGVYPAQTSTTLSITAHTVNSGSSNMAYNAADYSEVGFGAIMETGIVSETDTVFGGTGDKDSVIMYAVPRSYYHNKGVQSTRFFNYQGGTNATERFVDIIKKSATNFDIVKTSLHPTVGTTLILQSYSDTVKTKENIQLLGLKKSEFTSLKVGANAQLSPYHVKMCKLIPQGQRKRDADYESYYEYKLVISGLNNSGVYTDTTTFVLVYTRDGLIFTSEAYAKLDLIPDATYDDLLDKLLNINYNQRVNMINPFPSVIDGSVLGNKEQMQIDNWKTQSPDRGNLYGLYLLDGKTGTHPNVVLTGPMNTLPIDLRTELNALAITNPSHTIEDIEAIVKQKGSDLLTFARQRIKQSSQLYTNKDGILYITRLVARMVIRNHPVIIKSGKAFEDYEKLFEDHSRGFAGAAKVDFSAYPPPSPTYKRVLITGFDPFDTGDAANFNGGLDSDDHLTNAAGNIALALDGVELGTGTNKAIVRSAIFSTRWRDFDKDWVENFFKPFFDLPPGDINRPDLIITYSYGLHYKTYSSPDYNDHNHNWHLDRFAGNHRSGGADNLFSGAESPHIAKPIKVLGLSDIDLSFIESLLPYEKLTDLNGKVDLPNHEIVINHGPFSELGISDGTRDMKGNTGTFTFKVFGYANTGNFLTDLTTLYNLNNIPGVSKFNILEHSLQKNFRQYSGTQINFTRTPFTLTVIGFDKPILLKSTYSERILDTYNNFVSYKKSPTSEINFIFDNPQLKYRTPSNTTYYLPIPNWTNYKDSALEGMGLTDPTAYHGIYIEARIGSGGDYMSNEIHYRVSFLREKASNQIPNGHVHVGFHKVDPGGGTPSVRIGMINDVHQMIKKFNDIP